MSTNIPMFILITVVGLGSGQATAYAQTVTCDFFELNRTEARFVRLRAQRRADPGAVSEAELRAAALAHVRMAEACYAERYGADAGEPVYIDDGAVLLESNVAEFNTTNGRKWGAGSPYFGGQNIPGPGLPGGTVTWSFMPDRVNMSVEPAPPSVAIQSLPTFQPCFLDEIENAFDVWSAVADIDFNQVVDNGAAFDSPAATGAIRVGAHGFDGAGGILAHGFFPPPNGSSAAGDIHFDADENWACSDTGPEFDVGIVAIHELGHAIGLDHSPRPPTAIMNAFYDPAVDMLQPDDILGAESIYGAPGGCTLGVAAGYDGGKLKLTFNIGAATPTKFSTWLLYGNGSLLSLWSVDMPPIVPAARGTTEFPLPPIGGIGVLTALTTVEGVACSDYEAIDTTP